MERYSYHFGRGADWDVYFGGVFLFPVNEEHRQKAYQMMDLEGQYPSVLINGSEGYFSSSEPGVLDNGTDRGMLYTALDTSIEGHPFQRAMNMYSADSNENYAYYWHGYVSVLRPLLYFLEYDELRFFNWTGQFVLMLLSGMMVKKKTGRIEYVLLLMTSYLLLMPLALAMCLQYTWVFYIASISGLMLMWKNEWFEKNERYLYFFIVTGLLTSYFDLLTYPLFTWGYPLLWWLVTGNRDITGWKRVKRVIASGFAWIAGYAFMWIMKWVMGSLILKRNLFEDAIAEVFLRSGMGEGANLGITARLDAVYQNWLRYAYPVYFLILALWLLWVCFRAFRYGWHTSRDSYAYLLTACSSIVWYLVLVNHTTLHAFFTYRIFNISVTSFLLLLAGSVIPYRDKGEFYVRGQKRGRVTLAAGIILCIAAGGCFFLAREEIPVTNAYCSGLEKELDNGEMLEFSFVPTFSRIKNIGICLTADEMDGILEISVSHQGEVLYWEQVEISQFENGDIYYMPIMWKLHKGERYKVEYKISGNSSQVRLLVTEPGNEPLQEISGMTLNGMEQGGQPIIFIKYWNRPGIKKRFLFLACSWFAVWAGTMVTGGTALAVLRYRGKRAGR